MSLRLARASALLQAMAHAAPPQFQGTVAEDNSPLISYCSGWSNGTSVQHGGRNDHVSNTAGSTIAFQFYGTRIAIYGATTQHRAQWWDAGTIWVDGFSAGLPTVRITLSGTKNNSAATLSIYVERSRQMSAALP